MGLNGRFKSTWNLASVFIRSQSTVTLPKNTSTPGHGYSGLDISLLLFLLVFAVNKNLFWKKFPLLSSKGVVSQDGQEKIQFLHVNRV